MKVVLPEEVRVPRPVRVLVRVLPKRPVMGATVEFLAMFSRDGRPHDPEAPVLLVRPQDHPDVVTLPLEREAEGEWSISVIAAKDPGVWLWRVQTEDGSAVDEGHIIVQASSFAP